MRTEDRIQNPGDPRQKKGGSNALVGPLRLCVFALVMLSFCLRAWGQYAIDWYTIDGGGAASTGGVYFVTATIGQSDASTTSMTGGPYSLTGGFWSVIAAVQTPGAPLLSVMRTETNTVVISWTAPAEGWQLHCTTNLTTSGSVWTEIPAPYQTNGTMLQFIEPLSTGSKFYRLHKP